MAYPIETKICSKNGWHTPAEAKRYYGSYNRHGLTVHWWGGGEGASSHDAIVNLFLRGAAAGQKSVNYVVSDRKITKMVEPQNVAWTSQSGNPVTISIEFQPTLSAEGYKRGGWLIEQLEKKFGTLKLYKHSFWFPTACPGTIDLARLRREANAVQAAEASGTVTDRQKLLSAPVFDWNFYLSRYPDLRRNGVDTRAEAESHWLRQGLPKEGREGNRVFKPQAYINNNSDLKRKFTGSDKFVKAALHWFNNGIREGRSGH